MNAFNIIYNINILCLFTVLDNNNTIKYNFVYKFNYDNNFNKDLCIVANVLNSQKKMIKIYLIKIQIQIKVMLKKKLKY